MEDTQQPAGEGENQGFTDPDETRHGAEDSAEAEECRGAAAALWLGRRRPGSDMS